MKKEEQFIKESLKYHSKPVPGKTAIRITKSCASQKELSMAYTPGVAYPCLEIEKDRSKANDYTNRKNLVGVISNGTAVLGLGDIGPEASKPVMEGKAVLFKRFAGIDVFDIEIAEKGPERFIETVKRLEPTFGGINLEDIKAPECFEIETALKKTMDIPVFHDDQHGTAIIVGAGLLNALEIAGKDTGDVKVIFLGAGAAGISCAKFICSLGVDKKNIYMFDRHGLITHDRHDNDEHKAEFAHAESVPLEEAMKDTDVFIGLSAGNLVSKEMVRSMSANPVIFALANPFPEITYEDAKDAREDVIMATGRSDYPNQVNNVLGFPFIFRGALDTAATAITEGMKVAAAKALAALAKEPVLAEIEQMYERTLTFGPEYIIPTPFDPRVLVEESTAVAQAAMDEGVARITLDISDYREQLTQLSGRLQNE